MSAPPGKSNYGKVTSATPGAGNYESTVGASKYDAYAKVSDAKPQANYQILPSAQKLYEAAFAGGFVGAPTPPGAAPGAAPPGGPPARGPPPVAPRAQGAPPGLPSSGPPHAPLGAASDDKAKKKLCQRCETAKATAKVTIEGESGVVCGVHEMDHWLQSSGVVHSVCCLCRFGRQALRSMRQRCADESQRCARGAGPCSTQEEEELRLPVEFVVLIAFLTSAL
jgi:hypothetical protein